MTILLVLLYWLCQLLRRIIFNNRTDYLLSTLLERVNKLWITIAVHTHVAHVIFGITEISQTNSPILVCWIYLIIPSCTIKRVIFVLVLIRETRRFFLRFSLLIWTWRWSHIEVIWLMPLHIPLLDLLLKVSNRVNSCIVIEPIR